MLCNNSTSVPVMGISAESKQNLDIPTFCTRWGSLVGGRLRTRVSRKKKGRSYIWRFYRDLTESKTKMASRGSVEMNEAEVLRLSIEAELMNLTVEGLYQVAHEAGIRQGRYVNKNKMVVLREIRTYLDKVEQNEEDDTLDRLQYVLEYVRALLEEPQYWEQTPLGHQSRRASHEGMVVSRGSSVPNGHPIGIGNPVGGHNGLLSDSHESDDRSVVSDGGNRLVSAAHVSGNRSVGSVGIGGMGGGGRGIGRAIGILGPLQTSSGVGRGTVVGGPVGRGVGRGVAVYPHINPPLVSNGRGTILRQPAVPRTLQLTPATRQSAINRHMVSRSSGSGTGHDSQTTSNPSSDDSQSDSQSDAASSRAPVFKPKSRTTRSVPLRTHRRSSYVLPKVSGSRRKSVGSTVTVSDLKEAWRRELKLKGQIGKIGDKDKLDVLSVKRQIDSAIKKGYEDADIIEAVINATSSGSSLKGLLQVLPNLTVKEMMKVLRSYFQEFDGSDLLLQLTTAAQNPKDDALTFLIDVLFLKNRIIEEGKRSKEAKFGRKSVKKIMLKTLESGISSDRIVNRMRPFLLNTKVTDTELISEMSKAVRYEKDRKAKSKQTRVSSIEAPDYFPVEDPRDLRIAKLEAQLKALNAKETCCKENEKDQKIAKLEAQIREMRADDTGAPKKKKGRIYGCKACKSTGKGRTCSHCFVCGEGDHKVEKCPKKVDKVNSNRSSGGD